MTTLVGVGVGPGDPELVTVKAANLLAAADVVFVPVADSGETGRAEQTVLFYAEAWRVQRVVFALHDREHTERRERAWDAAAAQVAAWFAAHPGGTAAFATIGDPCIYSTFTYLAATVRELVADLDVALIPGITAMQDLAARTGTPLVEGRETLALLPMTAGAGRFREACERGDAVVAYKFGRLLPETLAVLRATGRLDGALYGAGLGLPEEDIRPAAELDPVEPGPYLSTLIVPPVRGRRGDSLRPVRENRCQGDDFRSRLAETVAAITPADPDARAVAAARLDRMTKPRGSLGRVEEVAVTLAGIAGACPAPLPDPAAVAVFAGDHGVHAQGVTPWPQEVTAQMVGNFLAGGAVVNALARRLGAEVVVVDVGVATPLDPVPGLLPRRVAAGTADMTRGCALTRAQAQAAVEVGIGVARDLIAAGNRCLVTGDMGIANTTAAAALICAFTGADPAAATGRGTGIDDATLARKTAVVTAALARHDPDPTDPIGVLAAFGGLEHAALAGFVLGAAALRVPVLLDGVNAGAGALVAAALAPDTVAYCVAGHRSAEPGHRLALAHLRLEPLLDLGMRLGEGTGALLALPVVRGAAQVLQDVATFDAAGVTDKDG